MNRGRRILADRVLGTANDKQLTLKETDSRRLCQR